MLECMSHSLHALNGIIYGIVRGSIIAVIKGDARSLDCSSYTSLARRARPLIKFKSPYCKRSVPVPLNFPGESNHKISCHGTPIGT